MAVTSKEFGPEEVVAAQSVMDHWSVILYKESRGRGECVAVLTVGLSLHRDRMGEWHQDHILMYLEIQTHVIG